MSATVEATFVSLWFRRESIGLFENTMRKPAGSEQAIGNVTLINIIKKVKKNPQVCFTRGF